MNKKSGGEAVGYLSLPKRQLVITMAGIMLSLFLSSLDQTVVATAMPRIIADLGGFAHYTWVTTAYFISLTVAAPITGKLTDLYGRKVFYITGLLFFIVASLFCGLSNSMTALIIWRGMQGIGAGIMMATTVTVVGDIFPPAERGKYQGLLSGMIGLSSIIGPTFGGFITDTLSWHWIFFFNIPLGVIAIILFALFFPDKVPDKVKHHIDFHGAIVFIFAVIPAMLALTWGGTEYPWFSIQITGMFAFSAVMIFLFLRIEKRCEEPIIPLSLFNSKIVAISEILIFFTGFTNFSMIIFIPLFFQGVMGLTATASGSFLTPMLLGSVAGSFTSGQLLSRAGGHYRLQGVGGLSIAALAALLLSRMTGETSYASALFSIILMGFGFGILVPIYTIAIQNAVPYKILGAATSSALFFRSIGGSIGLAVFGSVLNNRFAVEFMKSLPAKIKETVPPERLAALAHNPQELVNVQAQAHLKSELGVYGQQGAAFFEQILYSLRHALGSALSHVFLIALLVIVIAFIINLFVKEIPLRKSH